MQLLLVVTGILILFYRYFEVANHARTFPNQNHLGLRRSFMQGGVGKTRPNPTHPRKVQILALKVRIQVKKGLPVRGGASRGYKI